MATRLTIIAQNIYTNNRDVVLMDMAKISENGSSQVVCLPPKYRLDVDEVVVQQLGDAVILVPKESVWKVFVEGVEGFTTDIFDSDRNQGVQEERKAP